MFTLIIIAAVLYLLTGMVVGRQTYIGRSRNFLEIADNEAARGSRMEDIKSELRNLSHGICNLNYPALRGKGCDCSSQRKWRALHTELSELQDGGPLQNPPGVPVDAILAWPVYGFKQFVTPEVKPWVDSVAVPEERPLAPPPAEYKWVDVRNDPIMQSIVEQGEKIRALADADLAKIQKTDPDAFITQGDGVAHVINGRGEVIKTFR